MIGIVTDYAGKRTALLAFLQWSVKRTDGEACDNGIVLSRLTAEQAHTLDCNHIIIWNTIKRKHKICCSYFAVSVIDFRLYRSVDCCFNIVKNVIL